MNFKGSKTEQNLLEALKGESIARNKYTYYASKAKKEGYVQISKIFEDTANNEKEHAKIWFKLLMDGEIPTTEENLNDCIKGENYEHTKMYPEYARIAKEEGFEKIAKLFEKVAEVEQQHELRYKKLLKNIEDKEVFKKEDEAKWECTNCGYVHFGKEAPEICPLCSHSKAYFAVKCENY